MKQFLLAMFMLIVGTFALPTTSFAWQASSAYNCGNGGEFPMAFAGCRPGYYYEDWQNADSSMTLDWVGECLECPTGLYCAGGFAGPESLTPYEYSGGGSMYNCDVGHFPMVFAGCRPGYYYEDWQNADITLHPDEVGECLECPNGATCAGGFAGPVGEIACAANQIGVAGTCQTEKFSVTTTNNTTEFGFYLSAEGTFYIDWGDGTTETIARTNNTDYTKYEHEYASAGAYVVRFGGAATGYNADGSTPPTITFNEEGACYDECDGNWAPNIASISGSLSALFPMLGTADGRHPMFINTFSGATNLTTIPGTLFSDYTTGADSMFSTTFSGCTSLTTIPSNLFSGITTGATYMFSSTFKNCTSLTTIPDGLFSGITTGANSMFQYTFSGCTSLTTIPSNLFSGITTGATYMFASTFFGCTNLAGYIPPTTFAGLITNGHPTATNMWQNAFLGTKLATSCPAHTTQYITGYEGTGTATWDGKVACVPDCGAGKYMPAAGFACSACAAGSYCDGASNSYSYNASAAQGTASCSTATNSLYSNSAASASTINDCYLTLDAGKYVATAGAGQTDCAANGYCPGATDIYYGGSVSGRATTGGRTECSTGLYAPSGMWESAQCGRILHIGDASVYLRSTKKTTPSLNLDIDHDGIPDFFGNMSTQDLPMTNGTTHKLKLRYNNTTYSLHDDTVATEPEPIEDPSLSGNNLEPGIGVNSTEDPGFEQAGDQIQNDPIEEEPAPEEP